MGQTWNRAAWVAAALALAVLAAPGIASAHSAEHRAQAEAALPAPPADMADMDQAGVHDESAETAVMDHHAGARAPKPFFPRLLDWFGKWHTAAVHFPISLILAGALAEVLRRARRAPIYSEIARFLIGAGAVSAVGAAGLGWLNAGWTFIDRNPIVTTHRWIGTGIALGALLLWFLKERTLRQPQAGQIVYLTLLALVSAALGLNGYLGGALVHDGLDHMAF